MFQPTHGSLKTANSSPWSPTRSTGGRLQPVLMRPTPQLSVTTRGGGGGGGGGQGVDLGGVGGGV